MMKLSQECDATFIVVTVRIKSSYNKLVNSIRMKREVSSAKVMLVSKGNNENVESTVEEAAMKFDWEITHRVNFPVVQH